MPPPPALWLGTVDRVRVAAAPVIGFLCSTLAVACLVSLPDAAARGAGLRAVDGRVVAWAALAVAVAVSVALAGLVVSSLLGAGPVIAAGAMFALVGMALSGDVDTNAALVLALLTMAVGVGALVAGGLAVLDRLPPSTGTIAFLGWLLPLAGGWGVAGWFALQRPASGVVRFGLHPPVVVLAIVGVVLVGWAMLTVALEPAERVSATSEVSDVAWASLGGTVVGGAAIVMLIGFQPEAAYFWLRPVTLLTAALLLVGLIGSAWRLRTGAARSAYLLVVLASVSGPSAVQVAMLVSSRAEGGLSGWVPVLLLAAGTAGVGFGLGGGLARGMTGLVVIALACAAGWVLPGNEWLMLASGGPMCFGVALALSGGWRAASADRGRLRYVSVAGLAALLFGFLGSSTLTWALGAELTGSAADARAGGRAWLGLTFALSVLGAAVCTVLLDDPAVLADDPAVLADDPALSADDPWVG